VDAIPPRDRDYLDAFDLAAVYLIPNRRSADSLGIPKTSRQLFNMANGGRLPWHIHFLCVRITRAAHFIGWRMLLQINAENPISN